MRYRDIRCTLIKTVNTAADNVILKGHEAQPNLSTPRWLSLREGAGGPVRTGYTFADVMQPVPTRPRGRRRPRHRLGGVAINPEVQPWKA